MNFKDQLIGLIEQMVYRLSSGCPDPYLVETRIIGITHPVTKNLETVVIINAQGSMVKFEEPVGGKFYYSLAELEVEDLLSLISILAKQLKIK